MDFIGIGLGIAGVVVGAIGGLGIKKAADGKKLKSAEEQAQAILAKAKEAALTSDNQAKNRLAILSRLLKSRLKKRPEKEKTTLANLKNE